MQSYKVKDVCAIPMCYEIVLTDIRVDWRQRKKGCEQSYFHIQKQKSPDCGNLNSLFLRTSMNSGSVEIRYDLNAQISRV